MSTEATLPTRTRRQVTMLGAQLFALGAFIVALIYVTLKILLDFRHINWHGVIVFAYFALPLSGAFGAILAFRAHRMALTRKIPEVKTLSWLLLVLLMTWTVVLIYFAQKMRRAVLEEGRQRLKPAVFYAGLTVLLCVLAANIKNGDDGFAILVYGVFSVWFCCDALLINVLRTMRDKQELAPLPSQKFQYSLGTLFLVVFCSAAWVTGLVKLLG